MIESGQLVIGASYASIAALSLFTYVTWLTKRIKCVVSKNMLILGLFLMVPAVMHFFWAINYLPHTAEDAQFVQGIFAALISVLVLLLVYRWTENRNLLYIFTLYGFTIIAAYLNVPFFFAMLMITAFMISLLAFLDLFLVSSHHLKLGSLLGSTYALLSLLLLGLSFLKVSYPPLLWAIPNLFLAASIYTVYLDGKYCMILHPAIRLAAFTHRRVLLHIVFLRYVCYTVAICGVVFISAISIHELGHALVSGYYGCEQTRIIFDLRSFPHTEIACEFASSVNLAVVTLAGLLATSLVGGLLWLTNERFSMKLGKLLLVYGFLMGYQDLIDLGLSENIIAVVMLFALLALVLAFIEISLYYIRSQHAAFSEPPKKVAAKQQVRHLTMAEQ